MTPKEERIRRNEQVIIERKPSLPRVFKPIPLPSIRYDEVYEDEFLTEIEI